MWEMTGCVLQVAEAELEGLTFDNLNPLHT